MKAPTFTDLTVVGMHFREREGVPAKSIVANFIPPVVVEFEREPHNPYDPNAIKIIYNGQHIGYIEATGAVYVAPWIDEGHEYQFTVVDMVTRRQNLHPVCTAVPVEQKKEEEQVAEYA